MFYARRNADGRIEAIFQAKPRGRSEAITADHPDVVAFLSGAAPNGAGKRGAKGLATAPAPTAGTGKWSNADLAMARVIEDLIDVLIQKDIIALTDLPLPAQRKLMSRHGKRDDWSYVARLYPATEGDELG